ncbi:hypothetical protein DLB09_01340 [Salmonella enterica subsp. salamae]|nr:hypothetical protein [Salmonella enterica subsp. salamae]KKA54051.1 hypothetical protein TM63_00430 [Salmonella enterica subsp. salamae serovar 42:f,g,t:--]
MTVFCVFYALLVEEQREAWGDSGRENQMYHVWCRISDAIITTGYSIIAAILHIPSKRAYCGKTVTALNIELVLN